MTVDNKNKSKEMFRNELKINSSSPAKDTTPTNLSEISEYTNQILMYFKQTVYDCKNKILKQKNIDQARQLEICSKITREKQKLSELTEKILILKNDTNTIRDILKKEQEDLEVTRELNARLHKQIIDWELHLNSIRQIYAQNIKRNRSLRTQLTATKSTYRNKEMKMQLMADKYRKMFGLDISQIEMNILRVMFFFDNPKVEGGGTKKVSVNKSQDKSMEEMSQDKSIEDNSIQDEPAQGESGRDNSRNKKATSEYVNNSVTDSTQTCPRNFGRTAQFTLDFSNTTTGTITTLDPPIISLDAINQLLIQENNFYSFLKRIRKMFKEKM